jgi:hypothetical protein
LNQKGGVKGMLHLLIRYLKVLALLFFVLALASPAWSQSRNQVFLPVLAKNPVVTGKLVPQPTPSPAFVKIKRVVYAAEVDELSEEYVMITNTGNSTANLTFWSVEDSSVNLYRFPSYKLAPASSMRVWTRRGNNVEGNLYWGLDQPVWDNNGECARLRNNFGHLISKLCYP